MSRWNSVALWSLVFIMSILPPILQKTHPVLLSNLKTKLTPTSLSTRGSSLLFGQNQTPDNFHKLQNTARKMSTFHHPDHPNVPITLPDGLSKDQVLNFHPFNSWLSTLTTSLHQQTSTSHTFNPSPYSLRSIKIQSFDLFGRTRVGFLKLQADVRNDKNEWLPGAVFLRGPSVAMLVFLIPDDVPPKTDERYVLLTVQPRIAAGSLEFVELPAGMVDEEGEFAGTAAKEIEEELGLKIAEKELTNLSQLALEAEGDKAEKLGKGVYPSPGACDEFIPVFMHEKRVPREQLKEWKGKLTGLREHGEKISLRLVMVQDLWKVGGRDGKTLAAVALWEGLKREGRV